MIRLILCISLLLPSGLMAQKEVEVGGMTLTYVWQEEDLLITLTAPTTGWLGMGLNHRNHIIGSDLLLFHIEEGQAEGQDMYVVSLGNPKSDKRLGGEDSFEILDSSERDGKSTITFRLKGQGDEELDFRPGRGEDFWLIMAYSTHDDFGHHSRMRRHIPFTFQ